jgi:hypothetical protein
MRLVLVIAGVAALLLLPSSARGEDAVVAAGAIDAQMLAGGEGWLVWAHGPEDGPFHLRARGPDGATRDLPAAPISRLIAIDVGRGPDGRPTAVYRVCRGHCHVYTLALQTGAEQRLTLPRTPRACVDERVAIDRRLFIGRTSILADDRRCRAGIFERRGGRFVRRQAGRRVEAFDVQRGRLAYERVTSTSDTQLLVRRLPSGRARIVASTDLGDFDQDPDFHPAWEGMVLWVGVHVLRPEDPHRAWLERRIVGRRIRCEIDARDEFQFDFPNFRSEPRAWAFAGGAAYYTIDFGDRVEVRRRTDPPLRFKRCR